MIGGGELSDWEEAKGKVRGGGDLGDALLLLSGARQDVGGCRLVEVMHPLVARTILRLPNNLRVPDGRACLSIQHYNEEATAGPFLRSFGIRRKTGLKEEIEDTMWRLYDLVGNGELDVEGLPFITARVGYRTKLLSQGSAMTKLAGGEAMGRAVMMMDALEQAASMPLYSVVDGVVADLHSRKGSPWANKVVRASSMWREMWSEVKRSRVIVELDWKKFDRERPEEDLLFMIDLVCSCFKPENGRERRLLAGYKIMMRRALVDRVCVLDNGSCFKVSGMVPSGSLWTGWMDTALNILYLTHAFQSAGVERQIFNPKCAGDDNLTLFDKDVPDAVLEQGRVNLNEMFNAGIESDEFLIHRRPYHVFREQACFPRGVDLKAGTSDKLHLAEWRPISGLMDIDETAGRSHRWRYHYHGHPKFLSCYWLEDGLPLRPAVDSKERLLWPEGIHETLEDYEEAVMAMVIDNPFNDHTVNQMMHRYLIIQEVRRQAAVGVKPVDILWYSKFRPNQGGPVPYPTVGFWRRQEEWVDLTKCKREGIWVQQYLEFVAGITNLYLRDVKGGIDAWMFMDIIRGQRQLPDTQVGSNFDAWLQFLTTNKATGHLRAIRRYRAGAQFSSEASIPPVECRAALQRLTEGCLNMEWPSSTDFAKWVCARLQ